MKRKSNCRVLLGMVVFLALALSFAKGQTYEKSKHLTRSFEISEITEIQVSNKYGTVHIIPWDKDSVRFEIDLAVKANKESKVDKIYDYIDFDFTETHYYIIAQTEFTNKSNNFWSELTDIANMIFSGGNKAVIDYTVYVPDNNPLRITNKFGNIYLTDHYGKLDIDLSNGDLKAHSLKGESTINIEFGRGNIHLFESGHLKSNYSEVEVEHSDRLKLSSKSSTITLGENTDLILDTRRDKLQVAEASVISGESSFSYITIVNVLKSLNLKTNYGELTIKGLSPVFRLADINSTYTDIFLTIHSHAFIDLEINHDNRTDLGLPGSFNGIRMEEKDPEKGVFATYGKVGEENGTPIRIDINTLSGKVDIRQK